MRSLFGVILLLIGLSCNNKTVVSSSVKAPDYSHFVGTTELVTHLAIDKKLITDTIDAILDESLVDDIVDAQYDVIVQVNRSNKVKINVSSKAILLNIPLAITVLKKTIFGTIRGTGEVELSISSDISIDKYWTLKTSSKLLSHSWVKKPALDLGIKLPAQFFADLALHEIAPVVLQSIDHEMANQTDLESIIKETVANVEEPFQIDNQLGLWYSPQVNSISISTLVDDRFLVKLDLVIKATNHVYSQKPVKFPSNNVPEFSWITNSPDSSNVSVLLDLDYQALTNYVNQLYKGQVFTEGSKQVTVDKVLLKGEGGLLKVNCWLKGDFDGMVEFEGLPYFDKAQQSFDVREIDIKFKTKNIVAKGAEWLFKGRIKRELSGMLHIPLSPYMGDIQEWIDIELENYQKQNHIYLYTRLGSFDIHSVFFSDEKVNGILQFKLYMSAYLNDKRFFY